MTTLIFDCDGVLADTERFGHLPAFNQTFAEFGLPVTWSADAYGQLLKISGGKERMASLLTPDFVAAAGLPSEPDAQAAEVARWHARKTAIYTAMVAAGRLPARPRRPGLPSCSPGTSSPTRSPPRTSTDLRSSGWVRREAPRW